GRPGAFRLYVAMGSVGLADRLPHALHRGLPGNLYIRRFHDLLFQNGTHGVAPFAFDWQRGFVLGVDGAFGWKVVPSLQCGRKRRYSRHDADFADFDRKEHSAALPPGAIALADVSVP